MKKAQNNNYHRNFYEFDMTNELYNVTFMLFHNLI